MLSFESLLLLATYKAQSHSQQLGCCAQNVPHVHCRQGCGSNSTCTPTLTWHKSGFKQPLQHCVTQPLHALCIESMRPSCPSHLLIRPGRMRAGSNISGWLVDSTSSRPGVSTTPSSTFSSPARLSSSDPPASQRLARGAGPAAGDEEDTPGFDLLTACTTGSKWQQSWRVTQHSLYGTSFARQLYVIRSATLVALATTGLVDEYLRKASSQSKGRDS